MSLKLDSFEKQLDKIRDKLPDYLMDMGHDVTNGRKICCINPKHDDHHPSMGLFEVENQHPMIHCFSCGFSADIFTAAHVLEHKPKVGPGFVSDNVVYLADKFDIEISVKQLTEEEIYEVNTYDAYRMAADYISSTEYTSLAREEIYSREWAEEDVKKFQVGVCDDYDKFRNFLKLAGFSARFLDEIDLNNKNIFSPDNLIFTVCDDYGRPVGFASRNLKYDGIKDDNNRLINGPKFNNTKTTGIKCNIYRKSERLYLLHEAKNQKPPLYIVEGYGDAITLQLAGLTNAVAIGSLELSEHHLNTCRRNGIYDVVVCLDGDTEGQKKAKVLLDNVLRNVHDLKIRFIFLEEVTKDGEIIKVDPDLFIRNNSLEEFIKLPKIDPFEWRLMEFLNDDEADPESICFSMIPIIMNEPSPIRRERMIKDLSAHTGYSDKVIKDELDKIADSEEAKIQRKRSGVVDNIKSLLDKRSDSPEIILQRGISDLYNIEKERNASALTPESQVNNMLGIKQYEESEELHVALNFGPNFDTLSVALSGDLRGKMIVLGGTGNTGKTSKFCNLAWNLGTYNDDVIPIILTIDDSAKELVPRLVTYDMAMRNFHTNKDLFDLININKVATPFLFKDNMEYDAIMAERELSYQNLFKLTREERLVVLDREQGGSIDFINSTVKHYAEMYPEKRIIMFLDNFHLVDVPGLEDGRIKYKTLSKDLKQVCTTYGATVFTTAEYRKLVKGNKPTNSDLAETVALEYDANAILHLYSELHDMREQACKYSLDTEGKQIPIIEEDFGKNKINSYKGTIHYQFYPDKAMYMQITEQHAKNIENANRMAMESAVLEEQSQDDYGALNSFGVEGVK